METVMTLLLLLIVIGIFALFSAAASKIVDEVFDALKAPYNYIFLLTMILILGTLILYMWGYA